MRKTLMAAAVVVGNLNRCGRVGDGAFLADFERQFDAVARGCYAPIRII